jgi:hypothetical protein
MNRRDRRERIFHTDQDRRLFLETLGQASRKTGWLMHAPCLLPNHFPKGATHLHLGTAVSLANVLRKA